MDNLELYEPILIKLSDNEFMYKLACFHYSEVLEEAIIENNDLDYICYFAANVKEANISKLEGKVIESKDPEKIFKFAKNVKNANIKELWKAEVLTSNIEYIEKFKKQFGFFERIFGF